jgi:hypothetical protein
VPPSESKTPELELLDCVVPELLELEALELLLEALEASVREWLELEVLDAAVATPVVTG